MSDALYRHWVMLQSIPRFPRKTTVQKLNETLEVNGFETTDRTIQRDLIKLSSIFPLVSDDRDKPFGWSWEKNAPMFDLPAMDTHTALTFHLSEKFLAQIMPPGISKTIQPHFKLAESVLDAMPGKKLKQWRDKIRVLSRTQQLLSPNIDDHIINLTYQALLEGKQFNATYQTRNGEEQHYRVSPRGLVIRDQVTYLVVTLWNYKDIKQLLLHRMSNIELLEDKVKKLSFNLDDYINSGEFDFVEQEKIIQLKMRIENHVVRHLLETPLSEDQTVKSINEEMSMLSAGVKNTQQLRWWLLALGEGIEILQPTSLRKEMISVIRAMSEKYKL